MPVIIRPERPEDIAAIRLVNDSAFGRPQEGDIVEALREKGGVILSLVAALHGRVVGHILYSPVSIQSGGRDISGAGLGPMAVLPEFQGQGIGSRLVEEGNNRLREAGTPFIVVLGHPKYYPRFGFVSAGRYGIRSEWDVPEGVFMVLICQPQKMRGVSGVARYREEFSGAV